jgi:hypothetical protein
VAVVTTHAFLGLLVFGGSPVDFSSELDEHTFAALTPPLVPYALTAPAGVTVTSNLPISEIQQAESGARYPTFWDDYYNRIHVQPPVLDLGNVVTTQTYDVEVWNAYDAQKQFVTFGAIGTAGLSLAGVSPPATWRSLESKVYVLTATPDVDFVVDAQYTFGFASANQAVLRVIGRGDVVVLPLSPDWASHVKERLDWSTDVLRAQGGAEQRIRLRNQPRRAFSMVLRALDAASRSKWESIIFRQQASRFAVPVWTDAQRLPASLPAGSVAITGVITTGFDFVDGGLAVLWRSANEYEPVTITTVGAGTLNLYSPTNRTWPALTRLFPSRLARMGASQRLKRPAHDVAELPVVMEVLGNDGMGAVDGATTYRGYAVMTTKPHEPDAPEDTWLRVVETTDNGMAEPLISDLTGYPDILRSMQWLVGSHAEVVAIKRWLHARAGRLVPFWLPTWREDVVQTQPMPSSGTQLTIRHIEHARFVAANPVRKDLMLVHDNGTIYYRRVTDASEVNDDEEALTLDSPLGILTNPGDLTISYLDLVRLDSDSIDIDWETNEVAFVGVTVRTVAQ